MNVLYPSPNLAEVPRRCTLALFLAAQFIGLARRFFITVGGDIFNQVGAAATYGSLLLLPLLWVQYRSASRPGEGIGQMGAGLVTLLAAVATLCLLLGIQNGYMLREVIQDYAPYIVLCAFALIGSRKAFWDDLVGMLPMLLLAGLIVNAAGFAGFGELIGGNEGERVARESLAYRTQGVLSVWGIALLLMRRRSAYFKMVAISALIFYLFQQIFFQKRLGTAEAMLYVGSYFLLIPLLTIRRSTQDRIEDARLFMLLFTAGIAGFIILAALSGNVMFAQLESLFNRFVGLGQGEGKQGAGFISTVFFENERFALAMKMLTDYNPWEWIYGRGMGGYFAIDMTLNENDSVRQLQYESSYLFDVGEFGRRDLEIGILMPFMKGGIILLGVYGFLVTSALSKLHSLRGDPMSLVAWSWLLIESLYLLQGGGFSMSTSYRVMLLGACIGRCIAPTRVS